VIGLTTSATQLLKSLREKQFSPLELAEEHIRAIEQLNPQLNAIVDFDSERVRAQAKRVDPERGKLAGLPVTIKSSISTAGYKCEIGSGFYRNNVPSQDAVVVSRLRSAGAVILGTTNAPELLMAYETDNLLYGRTANPWNLACSAGGSSGGEAAAIAAGLSAAGLGSDSGGSVRQPAHATGICSLKPTYGRIPSEGHIPPCLGPFATLGAIGPMARTMEDVELLFSVLSGQDPVDPYGAPVGWNRPSLENLKRIPIGYFEDDGLVPVTPETRAAIRSAVEALTASGFILRPCRPRSLEEARKLWWTFFVRCGAMFDETIIKGRYDELSPTFKGFLEIANADLPLSAEELLFAWAESDIIRRKMLTEMQEYPVLLCPVSAVPAFRHGDRSWTVEGREVKYLDAMRYTQWFNTLGGPAAVVPVGQSAEGLPIGVQLAGCPFEDEIVLGIAGVLDREFGYRIPPLAHQSGVASY
jgi:Asp-tRNA(Asn)/Glu-tRNA(Gln) amidotransferase A subunit family amidase